MSRAPVPLALTKTPVIFFFLASCLARAAYFVVPVAIGSDLTAKYQIILLTRDFSLCSKIQKDEHI
jgi:hypothetical protein